MTSIVKKNENKEVGRPSEMTPETVNKLEEVFALDGTVEEACFFANISRTTYYTWIKDNPELLDRFTALRNDPILKARRTLIEAIKTNPQFALEYLKRKKKNEFSERQELDHTTKGEKITDINYIVPNGNTNPPTNL